MKYNNILRQAIKFEKLAALFEGPKEVLHHLYKWCVAQYISHVLYAAIQKNESATKESIELKNMILGIQNAGYLPSKTKAGITTKYPLSKIIDWKYLRDDEKEFVIERLKSAGWKDPIKITIYFSDKKLKGFKGIIRTTNNIEVASNIDVNNISELNAELADIYDTVKHEVSHLGQAILEDLRDLHQAGYPSKDEIDINPDKIHSDKDTEFYPMLLNAVDHFNRQKFTSREQQEKFFAQYVGELGDDSHSFFGDLKKINHDKWKKAVKELYKAIKWIQPDEKNKKKSAAV